MRNEQPSQADLILWHMRNVGRIDPITALREYGCFRLAARVHELRARGENVGSLTTPDGYAVYFILPPKPAPVPENEQRALWGDR